VREKLEKEAKPDVSTSMSEHIGVFCSTRAEKEQEILAKEEVARDFRVNNLPGGAETAEEVVQQLMKAVGSVPEGVPGRREAFEAVQRLPGSLSIVQMFRSPTQHGTTNYRLRVKSCVEQTKFNLDVDNVLATKGIYIKPEKTKRELMRSRAITALAEEATGKGHKVEWIEVSGTSASHRPRKHLYINGRKATQKAIEAKGFELTRI